MSEIKCTYCGIKIVPVELDFKIKEKWPYVPGNQWFHVEREGSGELAPRWDAAVDADWVNLKPSSGEGETLIIVSVKSVGKPAGVYEAHVVFTSQEATNTPVYATIKLTVTPEPVPLKITTTALPDGKVGEAYECQIEAEGGVLPYTWSGRFTIWTHIDSGTGHDNWNPNIQWDFYPIRVSVQDSEIAGSGDTADYAINIPNSLPHL